jgi:hypothetical protein
MNDRLLTREEMNELWYERASTHKETTKVEELLEDAAKLQRNITAQHFESVVIPAAQKAQKEKDDIAHKVDITQAEQALIEEIEDGFPCVNEDEYNCGREYCAQNIFTDNCDIGCNRRRWQQLKQKYLGGK